MPEPRNKPTTVLVVDDDPLIRRMVATLLKRQGFAVLLAEGGADALSIMAEVDRPIDLVVLDRVMPAMSGPELYHRLMGARPGLRVLFMSGYGDPGLVSEGQPVRFLPKPFTHAELLAAVTAALEGTAGEVR